MSEKEPLVKPEAGEEPQKKSRGCCGCSKKCCCCCGLFWFVVAGLLALALVVVIKAWLVPVLYVRTELFPGTRPTFMTLSEADKRAQVDRLVGAIQIPTISYEKTLDNVGNSSSDDAFERINEYIEESYPALHAADYVSYRRVNRFSRLYKVTGRRNTSNPFMLMSHLDVVAPGNVDDWAYDPFNAGVVTGEDGKEWIYGRGAIDIKHGVFGILEALEYMAKNGEQPERSLYVAFGHDEEVSGPEGAGQIKRVLADLVEEHDETIGFILDEGEQVVTGVIPGVSAPVIQVGVAEKGFVDVQLSVTGEQGHSSQPPAETTIGILARAVANVEEDKHPSRFGTSVEEDMLRYVAHAGSFPYKMVVGNLWMFSGLVSHLMSDEPYFDSTQRTSTAATIFHGGFKDNVIPSEASAVINHRIHPSDTLDDVVRHDVEAMEDPRVSVALAQVTTPSAVSPYSNDDASFQIVTNSALEIFPEGIVAPSLMTGGTDTKHFRNFTTHIYRFSPAFVPAADLNMAHGLDERVSVENYGQIVQFYYRLIKNAAYDIQ